MPRLVIVGGSDAGTEAALRARLADPALEITMLVADRFLNYSICGLPFFVSGEVADWRALAHRSEQDIRDRGIEVRLEHRATAIDVHRQIVEAGDDEIRYDRLIVATGARPIRPPIDGLDLDGVFVLHTMADGIALRDRLDRHEPESALVVGSGYIGVEMADALTRRGIRVTLLGRSASVLRTLDPSLGGLLANELRRCGVTIRSGDALATIERRDRHLVATPASGDEIEADLVVFGAGVSPNAELAATAGVQLGIGGAIRVNRAMETNVPRILAAGDCVETWHALLERPTNLPLGTTAHKQGRVAGERAAGLAASFAGSLGTQVVKVFELAAARTGLSEREAREAGFAPRTVEVTVPDHKAYYPGATDLHIRLTGDERTGCLLGVQVVGDWRAEVAKRIDVVAASIYAHLTVAELTSLDLAYTPPLGAPWDPIQAAADAWLLTVRPAG